MFVFKRNILGALTFTFNELFVFLEFMIIRYDSELLWESFTKWTIEVQHYNSHLDVLFPILTSSVQWVLWILLFSSNGEEEFPHKVRHIALLGQAQCTISVFRNSNNIECSFSIIWLSLPMNVAVVGSGRNDNYLDILNIHCVIDICAHLLFCCKRGKSSKFRSIPATL